MPLLMVLQQENLNTSKQSFISKMTMKGLESASMRKKEGMVVGLRDKGYPGYLTAEEFGIFVSCSICVFHETYWTCAKSITIPFQRKHSAMKSSIIKGAMIS